MLDLEEEVRVVRAFGALVDHGRWTDQVTRRDLRDVRTVAARDPMNGRVEVGAHVLAGRKVVPVPRRAAFVEVADLLQCEALGVGERWRKLQDRRAVRKGRRQVDDLDQPVGERRAEIAEDAHNVPSISVTRPGRGSLRAVTSPGRGSLRTVTRPGRGSLRTVTRPGRGAAGSPDPDALY